MRVVSRYPSSFSPSLMDFRYIDPGTGDSRRTRSSASSYLSSTAAQFQGLSIATTPSSSRREITSPDTRRYTSSPSFLDQTSQPSPSSFISQPAPQQLTPFPLLSSSHLDATLSYLSSEEQSKPTPLLRIDQAQPYSGNKPLDQQAASYQLISDPETMSTMGVHQYDGRFDAGLRQSYTWPHFDINGQYEAQELSQGMSPGPLSTYDDTKFMPVYARSFSSSPPRASLTPEQRILKRQRDHARRDSKTRVRRDRSTSNPYAVSQEASPDLLPRSVPEYSNTLGPAPLLSQASPTLTSPPFLSPYSPHIPDSTSPDVYGPVFAMSPNEYSPMPLYSVSYQSGVAEPNLQVYHLRPHSSTSSPHTVFPPPHQAHQHHPSQHLTIQLPQNPPPPPSPLVPSTSTSVSSTSSASHSSSNHAKSPSDPIRVVYSRPKPQCWEHGCSGRQFSTFSNLLRHQREKSGAATKSTCPNCGAEFTRTTARNGHMQHEKCKQVMRQGEGSKSEQSSKHQAGQGQGEQCQGKRRSG